MARKTKSKLGNEVLLPSTITQTTVRHFATGNYTPEASERQ